jgi:hypothetical protein
MDRNNSSWFCGGIIHVAYCLFPYIKVKDQVIVGKSWKNPASYQPGLFLIAGQPAYSWRQFAGARQWRATICWRMYRQPFHNMKGDLTALQ